MVRLVRSWPASPPPHPHVVDSAERNVNDDYDYKGLAGFTGNLIHLDWDIAVHREDLESFAGECRAEPGLVRVAPYRIYADSKKAGHRHDRGKTVWSVRMIDGQPCTPADDFCHLFGFGMVYLPEGLIEAAGEAFPDRVLDDITFAQWLHFNHQKEVPVCWQVRPVHLHYRIETLFE